MLLMTLVWRDARHGRWTRAGACLGLGMSIKPFLLIFVPYLILSRRWRGPAAAGLTIGSFFLLGLAVFGVENHRSWLQRLSTAHSWAWLPMNASLYGMLSRALTDNPMFNSLARLDDNCIRTIWLCLGIPAGLLALIVSTHRFFGKADRPRFGILLVSALLFSPLGWTYYFWLPLGPIASLAAGWWRDRLGPIGEEQRALPLVQATDARLSTGFVLPNIVDNLGPTPATGHFAVWEHLLLEFAAGLAGVDSRRSPPIQTLAQRPCR